MWQPANIVDSTLDWTLEWLYLFIQYNNNDIPEVVYDNDGR